MSGQSSNSNSLSSSISNMVGGGNSSNNFNQNIWKGQQKPLQNLYGTASALQQMWQPELSAAVNQASQYIGNINNQAMPAWQQQMQGGAYQGTNINNLLGSLNRSMNQGVYSNPYLQSSLAQSMQQPDAQASDQLIGSLNKSLNREFTPSGPSNASRVYASIMGGEGNNYADAMKGQYLADANNAQQQMLANLDARAAGEGMSGSSRHGVAEGLGIQGINRNLQEQLARTGYETFDKDLNNKLSIAQMADTNALNREGMYLNNQANAQQLGFNELQNQRGLQYGNLANSQGLASQLQTALQGLQFNDRANAQGMYGGLVGNQQNTMSQGLGNASNMQNLGMGSFAPLNQQWSGIQNLSGILGGPTILNSGSGYSSNWMNGSNNSASSAKSKSGGGGI